MPRWGTTIRLPDGTVAFIDGHTPYHKCRNCDQRRATIQCDYPTPNGRTDTCDAWLCRLCAVRVGPNRDFCPNHPWP
jgi:hypothetical protein